LSSHTIELELIPGRELTSKNDPRQCAGVHRTDDTVVLELTPAMTEVLAKIVAQHQASREAYGPIADDYDASLWSHLVVDLLAAKARLGHIDAPVEVPRLTIPAVAGAVL
jgi:hypothetical protein